MGNSLIPNEWKCDKSTSGNGDLDKFDNPKQSRGALWGRTIHYKAIKITTVVLQDREKAGQSLNIKVSKIQ